MGNFSLSGRTRRSLAFLAVAVVAMSACGGSGGGESSAGSTRTKNAALDTSTVACAVGGYGPAGGIVMSVGATTADQSIEVSRDWYTAGSGKAAAALPAVNKFAEQLSKNTKPGWFIPDQATLKANIKPLRQVRGNEFYWSSTPIQDFVWGIRGDNGNDDLIMDYNIGLYRAVAFRTFLEKDEPCTPPPTTTTVAPTTTVPLSCAAGGLCAVGDTGPGGGLIFLANNANDGSSTYLEVAPANWVGSTPSSSLVNATRYVFAPTSTGDGADALARGYRGGGKADWRLPTADEMKAVCRAANNTLRAGAGMWATDATRTGKSTISVSGGCRSDVAGGSEEGEVRPVRTNSVSAAVRQAAIDYYVANPTTTTSTTTTTLPPTTTTSSTTTTSTTTTSTTTTSTTTTTIKPTTTTARPTTTTTTVPLVLCTDLRNCTVGQQGPGGGIIIKRTGDSAVPIYLEIARAGWSTAGGKDPLVDSASASKTATDYRGGGFSDWRLPNAFDIEDICKFATGQSSSTVSYCETPTKRLDPAFGDGSGSGFASFYWFGTNPVRDQMDFATARRMQQYKDTAYVRPVRQWSYVPPTTTTTIPKSCKDNGVCKIGDISPTGGLIIDFWLKGGQPTYTEVAPANWFMSIKPNNWNGTDNDPSFARDVAMTKVNEYSSNVGKQWRLPTDREMRAAFLFFADNPTFSGDCRANFSSWRSLSIDQQKYRFGGASYWIWSQNRSGKFDNFNFATSAAYYDVAANWMSNVRPFAERPYYGGGSPVAATWPYKSCEYQAIPTTTTTTQLVSCAGRGPCSIGQIGPNGGVIIGITRGGMPGDITYTEMQIATRKDFDCQGTSWGNSCTTGQYDDFVSTRGLNGIFDNYPTVAELQTVAKSLYLKTILGMRSSGNYFSKDSRDTMTVVGDVNADGLKDLAKSLSTVAIKMGKAVNMGNGTASEMEYAYFRGVNRWRCQYSCIGR